jgi:hypothetical protein
VPVIETVYNPVAIVLGPTQPRTSLRSRLPSPPSNILFTHDRRPNTPSLALARPFVGDEWTLETTVTYRGAKKL